MTEYVKGNRTLEVADHSGQAGNRQIIHETSCIISALSVEHRPPGDDPIVGEKVTIRTITLPFGARNHDLTSFHQV